MTSSLSRRRFLGGVAASAGASGRAIAQGACRDGYGQGRCPLPVAQATAPIEEVFDPTGWKTLALESFTIDVADYRKEAAFYAALMGWKVRDDDGKAAVMDIGDWGSCIFRRAAPDAFGPRAPDRPAPRAVVRGFAWVIDTWDARKVAAALEQRGMTPVADNRGAFESFRVKDPDGWDLQICNGKGLSNARKSPSPASLRQTAPFAPTGWKTVWLDHMSFRVGDYKRSASFYANLLGWRRTYDEGSQNELMVGDIGDVLCRGGNPFIPGQGGSQQGGSQGASIDHISFGIAPWDVEAVREALESRGLRAQIDTSSAHQGPDSKLGPDDIYQAAFQSYHTETPNGFNLQISWNTIDKRLALANAVKPGALRKYPARSR